MKFDISAFKFNKSSFSKYAYTAFETVYLFPTRFRKHIDREEYDTIDSAITFSGLMLNVFNININVEYNAIGDILNRPESADFIDYYLLVHLTAFTVSGLYECAKLAFNNYNRKKLDTKEELQAKDNVEINEDLEAKVGKNKKNNS